MNRDRHHRSQIDNFVLRATAKKNTHTSRMRENLQRKRCCQSSLSNLLHLNNDEFISVSGDIWDFVCFEWHTLWRRSIKFTHKYYACTTKSHIHHNLERVDLWIPAICLAKFAWRFVVLIVANFFLFPFHLYNLNVWIESTICNSFFPSSSAVVCLINMRK